MSIASRLKQAERIIDPQTIFRPTNGPEARMSILGSPGPELAAGDRRFRLCIALQAAPNDPAFVDALGLPDTSDRTIVARARAEGFTEAEISFLRHCLRQRRANQQISSVA